MADQVSGHMTPEELRRYGRQVVDWIADYQEKIESFPVLSQVSPGEIRAQLPAHPPERGERFEAILTDVDQVIMPGVTHWQHPSFFAYYPANASGPAILADLLSAGLGVQGMAWATSPACTELEQHMLDWLAELLGLPVAFRFTRPDGTDGNGGGVIQDTASTANLTAVLAALHRATGGAARRDGLTGRYAVYASSQGNSSIPKAVIMAGLGEGTLRTVDVDPATQALDPARLRRLIEADRAAGVIPVLVVASVGTTSTSAVDPVQAIGRICREHGVWLHVDAAYAGVAAVCPELRWLNDGLEHADSFCTNPHKWLLTNFDCDAFYVADRSALLGALSILPEYLRNAATESGAVVDYRDWHIQLGRRFRALKLWAVIRWYGAEGLRAHIRRHVAAAADLASWVAADERFEVVAPHPLSLVCFRLRGPDGPNEGLLARLNETGEIYLTHTRVNGAYTLRLAIGGTHTEHRHVERAWQLIQQIASSMREG
ncbi:MAG TPA: pyridoxal-dependent decarboxylase [Mycobacteriales bacterium]|nr:pyridoxal-dependent decarboxylase [Mycobacteriales bacterium]